MSHRKKDLDKKDLNKEKKRHYKPKKKEPYEVKVGWTVCPKCNDNRSYTMYTRTMPYYDEVNDRYVTYLHAYGKCNKFGTELHTNKMRALNNKAIKLATKVPYDWKAQAIEKARKQQAEQQEEQ